MALGFIFDKLMKIKVSMLAKTLAIHNMISSITISFWY
jgi:hypothetical protein